MMDYFHLECLKSAIHEGYSIPRNNGYPIKACKKLEQIKENWCLCFLAGNIKINYIEGRMGYLNQIVNCRIFLKRNLKPYIDESNPWKEKK